MPTPDWTCDVRASAETYHKGMARHCCDLTFRSKTLCITHVPALSTHDHYLILRDIFCALCGLRGAPLLHASSVDFEGRAVIFCGVSGTGKTTISRLLSARHQVINDEINWLQCSASGFTVVNQPFWRLKDTPEPSLPLASIYLLEQAETCEVRKLDTPLDAMGLLLCAPYGTEDPALGVRTAATMTLATAAPLKRLRFSLDSEEIDQTIRRDLSA